MRRHSLRDVDGIFTDKVLEVLCSVAHAFCGFAHVVRWLHVREVEIGKIEFEFLGNSVEALAHIARGKPLFAEALFPADVFRFLIYPLQSLLRALARENLMHASALFGGFRLAERHKPVRCGRRLSRLRGKYVELAQT